MGSIKLNKRLRVMEMFNFHCAYCGCRLVDGNSTIDHVIAKKNGGTNHYSNLIPSCKGCNSRKSDMTIDEFRDYLVNRINGIFPNTVTEIEFYFEKKRDEKGLFKLWRRIKHKVFFAEKAEKVHL